jgi:hypothetical protein
VGPEAESVRGEVKQGVTHIYLSLFPGHFQHC